MRFFPKSYLVFRDRFSSPIRWVIDLIVFVIALYLFGFIVAFIAGLTAGLNG